MSRHDDLVRLRHMRDYAREAIAMAANRSQEELATDRMFQLALTHLVGIIGEAASRVSDGTREEIPRIPWANVIGMRHRLIHGYDRVNLKILWDTISVDLEPLVSVLEEEIRRIESGRSV